MIVTTSLARYPETPAGARGLLSKLEQQPDDGLLALIGLHRADARRHKVDVGVGVYKDGLGRTPVLAAVKAAEAELLAGQDSKCYLGLEGDVGFLRALTPMIFGPREFAGRLSGLQTPGGTGALRLAAEVIARARPAARVHVGTPTWPNHQPLMEAAGLRVVHHRHFDPEMQAFRFSEVLDAIAHAHPGEVVLLHGCCHNPTGADFSLDQWREVAQGMAERRLLPLVDLAYHGLGDGLDADVEGIRILAEASEELLLAYSCDKNFGLYRERVGALFAISADAGAAAVTQSNLLTLARANWSMPPDHGAAIVRIILESPQLTRTWRQELEAMRLRIASMRSALAELDPRFAALATQKGMFSTLPLSAAQVAALRDTHAVYVTGSGRINIAGLIPETLANFARAVAAVR